NSLSSPQAKIFSAKTGGTSSSAWRWVVAVAALVLVGSGAAALWGGTAGNLFSEWFGTACLVDANGDDVLDVVGRSGSIGGETQALTIVDGRDGAVLWKGPADVGHED